jgi:alkylation response protein AidB-like acyl-CoA dehydrogenase
VKLEYTAEQNAFRAEVRDWMEANVPSGPLPSFDLTREGFEAHREWERKLNQGRWGMVTWPEELGGRGLDYIRWLIFEEDITAPMRPPGSTRTAYSYSARR